MHAEFVPGADFAHGSVANNEHLVSKQIEFLLDDLESAFFGEQVAAIGEKDFVNCRMILKAKRSDFLSLNLWLSEGDDKNLHVARVQHVEQRDGSAERSEFTDGTMEVGVASGPADFIDIGCAEVTADGRVNVAEHGIVVKGAHTGAIDGFNISLEPSFDHGFGGMAVRRADTLTEAVVERVVKVEDDAADEGFSLDLLS
ncbi:MAG TPA: hypothetical protein VE783_13555 [Candidatus Limnocylindrales bacterium]|nr:hypothetical protein [Candidatus Limnocylindrales bacterium]